MRTENKEHLLTVGNGVVECRGHAPVAPRIPQRCSTLPIRAKEWVTDGASALQISYKVTTKDALS